MKRIIIGLLLAITVGAKASAQKVYNEVKRTVEASLCDDTTNSVVRSINQFKKDALDYMLIKMREQMPDSSTTLLDEQALALNQYVSVYIKFLTNIHDKSKEEQVEVLKLFMDASYSNPFFHDPDTELTLGYYNNEQCLTRFSLDTDWRQALAAVLNHKF